MYIKNHDISGLYMIRKQIIHQLLGRPSVAVNQTLDAAHRLEQGMVHLTKFIAANLFLYL